MGNVKLLYISILKQQLVIQEGMLSHLVELDAMFEPLLAGNLMDFPIVKLHDYLGAMRDLVIKTRERNEYLINMLLKICREDLD